MYALLAVRFDEAPQFALGCFPSAEQVSGPVPDLSPEFASK